MCARIKMKTEKKKTNKRSTVKCCGLKLKKKKSKEHKTGEGFIDQAIDKLPFELHVPSYQYCGPGTKLNERLKRGDSGINPLDAACKTHDIAYSQSKDSAERGKADKILQKEAINRVFSKDASIGERATALGVAAAMKIKRTITGNGLSNEKKKKKKRTLSTKKKNISFKSLVKNAKVAIKEFKPDNLNAAIKVAMVAAKKSKKGKNVREPRKIQLPSVKGGILPLVPIFAGLGALGSIVGSAAGVANVMNNVRKGQKELEESKRHNQTMEAIAVGAQKGGRGLYLHRFKKGTGLYLKRFPKNH